jgi:hypothetical protein
MIGLMWAYSGCVLFRNLARREKESLFTCVRIRDFAASGLARRQHDGRAAWHDPNQRYAAERSAKSLS